MNLKRNDPSSRAEHAKSFSRYGLYSAVLIAAAVVVVLLFNLAVHLLPAGVKQFDLSSQQLYTVSDTSKEFLAALDKDVDLILIAENGSVDERISAFAEKYAALSDHVRVSVVDPVQDPSVLTRYGAELNTAVISCPETGKQQLIAFTDIIVMDPMYAYYGYDVESEFDAEGQFTSAIDAVTGDTAHAIYTLAGHGESDLGANITDRLEKNHFTVAKLNLALDGAIPEDCSLLLVNQPTSDLSSDELSLLEDYLAQGGQVAVILDSATTGDCANLVSLLNTYGLDLADGYLADPGRMSAQYQSPFVFFPVVNASADSVTAGYSASDDLVMVGFDGSDTVSRVVPMTRIDPARDTITVDAFLKTTTTGQIYEDQTAGEQGVFTVGAVCSENVSGARGETARLLVVSADTLLDDTLASSFPSLRNLDVFMTALTAGFDDVSNISIAPKSLTATYNTVNNVNLLGILCVIVIPGVFLVGGFVLWVRRRRL